MDIFDISLLSSIKHKDKAVAYVNKYFAIQSVDKNLIYYEFIYANGDLNQIITHNKTSMMKRLKHGYIVMRGRRYKIFKLWIDDSNRRIISQNHINLLYNKIGGLPLESKSDFTLILDALKNYLKNEMNMKGVGVLFLDDLFEHYQKFYKRKEVKILPKNKYNRELKIYFENHKINIQRVIKEDGKRKKKVHAIKFDFEKLWEIVSGEGEVGGEEFNLNNCPYFNFKLDTTDFKEVFLDTSRPEKIINDDNNIYTTYSLLKIKNKFRYAVIYKLAKSGEATENYIVGRAEILLTLRVRNNDGFDTLFLKNMKDDKEVTQLKNLGQKKDIFYTHLSDDDEYMKQKVLQSYCLHCINLG